MQPQASATLHTRRSRTPGRVLVAEDDPNIRRLVITMLRRSGLTVDAARDGEEAKELMSMTRYRVLVTDLNMPRMSGWDLIAWLRRQPDRCPASVIVISACERGSLKKLDPDVVKAVLVKPFDAFALAAYVRSAAERSAPDRRRGRLVRTI
ncbi:MAG: response regulator [Acidobacteriota bacterium]